MPSWKQTFDLTAITQGQESPLALFAVTSLSVIDSLASGSMTPTEATANYFHGKNVRFVKLNLSNKRAAEVMGRGLQLSDLFDAMPVEEAHREFQHELRAMKALCHQLLEVERVAA